MWRRLALIITAVVAGSMVAALDPPIAVAADMLPKPPRENVIPHVDVPPTHRSAPAAQPAEPMPASTWPAAGTADVSLAGAGIPEKSRRGDLGAAITGPRRAGTLPVTLSPHGQAGDTPVQVRLADQSAASRAGVSGVLLSLSAGVAVPAQVAVDYSGFRHAGGADFGSRLRLVRLPSCALSTPQVPSCQVRTPLPSRNDPTTSVVSAEVAVPATAVASRAADTGAGSAMVLAAVADSAGSQGTFQASSLAPSGTWSVSGSSGAFGWSYPISVPAAATGSAPGVSLGYSSSSVDGRTSGTNNQPSWVGQGWDFNPGFIERTYRTCAEDESLPAAQRTGDLCWAGQIVTMSLNGRSVPLVYDDVRRDWRPAQDDGSRVELVTGAANGVRGGEHWRVTTTDGVQYWFGRHRGPGYTNQEQTNSAWSVPVYGARADCAQAPCTEAWRWNLDFVEDPHGNTTAYYYTPETNYYGANDATTGVAYVRGGTLARADYGLRKIAGSIYGSVAPRQVVFTTAERCDGVGGFSCDPALFTAANASHWPDTPQDQQCLAAAVCNNHAPTFWTTKKLSTITTQYNAGAGPVVVDRYQLTHSFPTLNNHDLRLDSIVRTGYDPAGNAVTLPPVTFASELLDNRVPGFNNEPAMAHWRLTAITTDTGSEISVTYSQPDCALGHMPSDPASNTQRCFPVYRTLPYNQNPILDYFHKYVVTQVQVRDPNPVAPARATPRQITRYTYLGSPAWHFDDNELVKPANRTYGQYRGYGQVEVRTGVAPDPITLTRTSYLRGMGGTVTNSLNETIPDLDQYADTAYQVETFAGDGGALLTTQRTEPTTVATTAARARTGLPALTANIVGTARTRTDSVLAAGGTRTATATNRYDPLGRLVATTHSGTGVPDLCTTTRYADNTTSWIRDRASETLTSQQVCPGDGVTPAPILSGSRTYFDNSTTLDAVPAAGDATRTEAATDNTNATLTWNTTGQLSYDPAGRPLNATDALGNITKTAYTPVDGGLLSTVVTTNAKNQTSRVELEPSRGQVTGSADVGGRRADATYDPLGRTTAIWKPGRTKAWGDTANTTFAYLHRNDGPLAVTSKTLVDYSTGTNYLTSINLYDALGQLRQTQTDAVSNPNAVETRVATDIFYDSHGWAVSTNNRYTTTGAPATTLISVADSAVDDRAVTTFDGAGRATQVTAYRGLTATWDTRTIYGGDRTTVIPPQGAVTTTTVTDTRGRTTELRQYTAPPTVSGNVVSGGTFQTTGYHYTARGQLDQVSDPAGNIWTYGYDLLGRQTSAADPDSGARSSSYNLAGQLTSTTDARGQTLAYKYDVLGRKTDEYSGSLTGTRLASWAYDTARNGVGLLTSTTRYTTGGNYLVGQEYTGAGLIAKQTIRIPTSETGLNGDYLTTFSYTTTGQRNAVSVGAKGGLPAEGIVTEYNRYGNPKTTRGNNIYVSDTTYTPYGEASQYALGVLNSAGTLTYDRDAQTRRLTGVNLSVQQAWPQVDDLRYSYDPAGNLTRITNTQGQPEAGAPVRTQCFNYDTLDRLAQAWTATDNCAATTPSTATVGGPTPYWTSWTFDPIGLRHNQTQHGIAGAADTTTTYTYPPSGPTAVRPHALSGTSTTGPTGTSTTSYGYNQTGDTTTRTLPTGNQTLTWNEHNRLSSVTTPAGTTSYIYDADGTQLIRRDPGKTTLFLPGQEITRSTAGTVTGTRYYTHNGTTIALRVGNTNISYLQSDQHGTTQVAVKAEAIDNHTITRREFDPYGNPLGVGQGIWPDTHAFLNKPHNPTTNLTDIGARNYDPSTGRFLSVDPLLDLTNPQSWTGYTYSNNNPTTFSDPTGLTSVDDRRGTCSERPQDCQQAGTPGDWRDHKGIKAEFVPDQPRASVDKRLGHNAVHADDWDTYTNAYLAALKKWDTSKPHSQGASAGTRAMLHNCLADNDSCDAWGFLEVHIFLKHLCAESGIDCPGFDGSGTGFSTAIEAGAATGMMSGGKDGGTGGGVKGGGTGPLPTQKTGRTQKLTNSQATDLANYLGYKRTNEMVKGEIVFTNGKNYIVQDSTSHNGGTWKIAKSVSDLRNKKTRTATTDALLTEIGR